MAHEHKNRVETARGEPERRGVPAESTRPYIRLHSDENPYGCSLHVLDLLGSADTYHLPADPVSADLRAALSTYTGFAPERIVAGRW
jgi:histidinol-phosphate/aromatic aminotransferase/cobyric acid decarboxylase-like protein